MGACALPPSAPSAIPVQTCTERSGKCFNREATDEEQRVTNTEGSGPKVYQGKIRIMTKLRKWHAFNQQAPFITLQLLSDYDVSTGVETIVPTGTLIVYEGMYDRPDCALFRWEGVTPTVLPGAPAGLLEACVAQHYLDQSKGDQSLNPPSRQPASKPAASETSGPAVSCGAVLVKRRSVSVTQQGTVACISAKVAMRKFVLTGKPGVAGWTCKTTARGAARAAKCTTSNGSIIAGRWSVK